MQAQTRSPVLVDAVLPLNWVQTRVQRLAVDAVLVVGFAWLIVLCAQIAIRIPTTTVPITGQTFAVLLTGGALGSKRGGLSALVYMLLGMFAVPAFAPGRAVMAEKNFHFIFPWKGTEGYIWDLSSGGYIVGFILAAFLVGWLAEHGWAKGSKVVTAMLLGNIVVYLVGLPWLAAFIASGAKIPGLELTYYDAISGSNVFDKMMKGGLYPFIGGDAVKLVGAMLVLPGAWWLVRKMKSEKPPERRGAG